MKFTLQYYQNNFVYCTAVYVNTEAILSKVKQGCKFLFERRTSFPFYVFIFVFVFGLGVSEFNKLINLCFILVKKVIYDGRSRNQIPSIAVFKHLIKFHYTSEKQIAVNNSNSTIKITLFTEQLRI